MNNNMIVDFQNQAAPSNLLDSLDRKNSIQKEIAKDIILHKVHKPVVHSTDGVELKYMFIIESNAFKEVEFIADFTGSENVIIEQSSSSAHNNVSQNSGGKGDKAGLIVKKDIGPYQTELVAKVRLMKNWKLKSKFRFTLKNPPIERQKEQLRKYLTEHKQRIEFTRKVYSKTPFSLLPLENAEMKLKEFSHPNFLDLEFEPSDSSVYDLNIDSPFDVIVHWRRPNEFLKADYSENLMDPAVFYETIEPNDIKPGVLGNEWFLSAVSTLAERPALIDRLFITDKINSSGIYRVKFCKNGEWVTVTVDDYFPCYPEGEPLFARAHGNELWVMLLEKAYAKLHGNYYLMRGGFVHEALLDLTGCPTISYDLDDEYVQHFIENGQFWELIKYFDDEGYLLSLSTHGEGRWIDNNQANQNHEMKEVDDIDQTQINPLPKGQAFAIVLVKDVFGNQLLNIRSSLQNYEWKGDWSERSQKWTQKIKDAVGPVFVQSQDEGDGTFWMSYQDALKHFKSLNVCRVKNWEEVRIKGKFIRVQDIEDPNVEVVISKWYYSIDLHEQTKIFIGLHQEDERIKGVISRRQYLDIGIAILKRTNEGVDLVDLKDFVQDRQCEIEVNLEPGSYIILPRTTGCTLKRPENAQPQNIQLLNINGQLHEILESTIEDIFHKFDMLLNQELTYCEFKGFCECIGRTNLSEKEFQQEILAKFNSTSRGITLKGFKEFFKHQIQETKKNYGGNDENIWQWLENLGYDKDLYSVRSRCFILTFHSAVEVSATVRDAVQTDLDSRTNLLVIDKFGQELENKKGYKLFYTFSEQVHAYSYAVQNNIGKTVDITLDCSHSQNMLFSSKSSKITKRIEAGHTEFMMHSMAMPNINKFVRSAKQFLLHILADILPFPEKVSFIKFLHISIAKYHHLSYTCVPEWQQPSVLDPFDYKLRAPQEVAEEHKLFPPTFPITVEHCEYPAGDKSLEQNLDFRETVCKIYFNISDLNFSDLQRERFIYLLGPRYTGSGKQKLVCHQFRTYHENYVRVFELLRELFWEAKRAPQPKIKELRNPYKRERVMKQLFGKTKAEREKTYKEWNEIIEKRKIEIEAEELGLRSQVAEVQEVDTLKLRRQKKREEAKKRFTRDREVEHMTRLDFLQQKPLDK